MHLEFIFPLVHQRELGMGKARLLTPHPPQPLPPQTPAPCPGLQGKGCRSPLTLGSQQDPSYPEPRGCARPASGAPREWPIEPSWAHHESLKQSGPLTSAQGLVLDVGGEQRQGNGLEGQTPARAPPQPSGSSRECLGGPGSQLSDAPFSSLLSCRWLDFPGQSRVGPGWAPSARSGPWATL